MKKSEIESTLGGSGTEADPYKPAVKGDYPLLTNVRFAEPNAGNDPERTYPITIIGSEELVSEVEEDQRYQKKKAGPKQPTRKRSQKP